MQKKKFVTAVLTVAMLGAGVTPVWADAPLLIAPNPTAQPAGVAETTTQEQVMNWMLTMGTVKEVIAYEEEQLNAILVESNEQDYEFYLAETTWLVDGAGNPTDVANLVDKTVVVAHDEAMTLSLPPKSAAVAVMVYDTILPNYAIIEAITVQEDGTVVVTTDNGDRLVTIMADAAVSPFRTRNIVTLQDLRVGDSVVLYYDVLAPSIPAQASTAKVVQLAAAPMDTLQESGVTTEQTPEMVCLRDAAEAMGMELLWDGSNGIVTLSKDAFRAMVYIGSDEYGINRMRGKAAMPAELRDGRTWVSSDVVEALQAAIQ